MKFTIFFVISIQIIFTANLVLAESEYTPSPFERAPQEKIECSWSKLNPQQYKDCLKRKKYFNKMSDTDKKKFNEEVENKSLKDKVDKLDRPTR